MSDKACFDLNSNVDEGKESPKAADVVYNDDSDNGNLEESVSTEKQLKRKCYHRYSRKQVRELEGLFAKCPHPNKKQRVELGQKIGINQLHVKFWFQNKLTKLKVRNEHTENLHLREENERLHAENKKYKEALRDLCCNICRARLDLDVESPQLYYLLSENDRLKQEKARMHDGMAIFMTKYEETTQNTTSSLPLSNLKDDETAYEE